MSKLAIFGGKPVRKELFPAYNTIGIEERKAVDTVLASGVLSKYLGCWDPDFYGGPVVQDFERQWAEKNHSEYAISINSNTSGLITALGAVGVQPGDEVIVSPYTMSASASSCLVYGGIPVFADIDPFSFNISKTTIESKITSKTKAILVVHIFGYPADMDPIMKLANKHGIKVIEDCAQSPFAKYKGKYVGNLGHIGVFSLNYHKHIHTGEGGIITTNDKEMATRCQLIRNHAEAVVEGMGITNLVNMWGFNLRMPEMEAAIGREQLKKIDVLLEKRRENAKYLIDCLKGIKYLDVCDYFSNKCPDCDCSSEDQCTHSFYVQPIKYFADKNSGLHRNQYLKVLGKELPSSHHREKDPLIGGGYVKPLYLQPLYQKVAFNTFGRTDLNYPKGLCPVAEEMHYDVLIAHEFMRPSMSTSDLDQVIEGFYKVDHHMNEVILRQNEINA